MHRPVYRWNIALSLDESDGAPLSRRIARAIMEDVRRGRLTPGAKLPGSRSLADVLNVHRNTVIAAYEQLAGEGWIEPLRARGTFIARSVPPQPRRAPRATAHARAKPLQAGFDVPGGTTLDAERERTGLKSLSDGVPDVRLAPVAALTRAYRRVLRQDSQNLLEYGHPQGHPRLRTALAEMLRSRRGLMVEAEDVLVTSGSQMALELLARALLRPGDTVAVEALGYRPAWTVFRQHGAALAPLPLDAHGLDVAALERLCERSAPRAVYVTPHHQFPTTVTLTAPRRIALLELARRKRFAIIEDDYDHEFHYEGRPVLPMASADGAGVVLYLGSLAKALAPGVRLGYLVAPRPLLALLTALRASIDRQGDHGLECAVADLLERGELQRHAQRVRRIYRTRRNALTQALERQLGTELLFAPPAGGMTVWAAVADGLDVEAWAHRLRADGLLLYTARRYAYDGKVRGNVRLAFAPFDEQELAQWVRLLRKAL